MKKVLCALIAVFVVALSGVALADEEPFVREEAARRNMKLISREEAMKIARERVGSENVRFKDAELEDEDDYYKSRPDFRPVWSFEAVSGGREYDIDVDAVTGEVLKFKLDD